MTKLNKAQATDLKSRLTTFFADNPDEELTYAILVQKFDIGMEHARAVVQSLCVDGTLESVHVIRARTKGIAK